MAKDVIKETKTVKDLTRSEIEKIFLVTKPYYIDPSNVLDRELEHNNHIYLIKDRADNILSFFMVSWEKHLISNEEKDCIYLGLSCANQNNQEKRFASRVYYYFTTDAFNYEQESNNKVILYGTTATPVVLLTLSKIWDNVKPELEGSYTQFDKEIIDEIKKSTGLDKFSDEEHSFVLKGIAENTKYSVSEKTRLKEFELKNNITIFEKLNIKEDSGDRLLITCNVPDKSKLNKLKIKLFD